MAKNGRGRGGKPCGQGIINHLISKHIRFECTPGPAGKPPGVAITVSVEGKGESPCDYCTVLSVTTCPKFGC